MLSALRGKITDAVAKKRHAAFSFILFSMFFQRLVELTPAWGEFVAIPLVAIMCFWSLLYYALPLMNISDVRRLPYGLTYLLVVGMFIATYLYSESTVLWSIVVASALAMILLNMLIWRKAPLHRDQTLKK